MLAYKIITTVIDVIFMLLILLMKKENESVSVLSFLMILVFAMNIGLVWN